MIYLSFYISKTILVIFASNVQKIFLFIDYFGIF